MDAGPVSAARTSQTPTRSWKLNAPHDAAVQGLVVSGFADLPTGRALFLRLDREGGGWLKALDRVAPVSDAAGRRERATALAFTATGLARIGLPEGAMRSFAPPFREGMYQEDRLRRLGDRVDGRWQETVVEGGARWSANAPLPDGQVTTAVTVHALLLLYARDEDAASAWCGEVEAALAEHGATVVHRLPLVLDVERRERVSREHFGFADGLSQPFPHDGTAIVGSNPARERNDPNAVPLGEILIGHRNGHDEVAPGPVVPSTEGRAEAAGLVPDAKAQGLFDFGRDGSYMVVRELHQDVAAFWTSMRRNAERMRLRDPAHSGHVTAEWLAERVVGRTADGHLLCPGGGVLAAAADGLPDSDYLFHERDLHGLGCPLGSHVRRANPRDTLAPKPGMRRALLDAANNHRILRRGRKYGARMDPADAAAGRDDGVDRGLLFVCLNTDIARQFEFVQQTWLLNRNFATLFDEVDPLVGPSGRMTIPEEPLRRAVTVETYVKMAGGDYFFLPSLPAIRYLASL